MTGDPPDGVVLVSRAYLCPGCQRLVVGTVVSGQVCDRCQTVVRYRPVAVCTRLSRGERLRLRLRRLVGR